MKNKKIVLGIITIISTILVVCLIGFSPNIVNRLRGNATSFENNNGTPVKTGVVIDTKLWQTNPEELSPLKIYNGADKPITIKSIIGAICSNSSDTISCDGEGEMELDQPIVVNSDTDYEYKLPKGDLGGIDGLFLKVGIQYELDGKIYNLSTYTFLLSSEFAPIFTSFDKSMMNSDGLQIYNNSSEFKPKDISNGLNNSKKTSAIRIQFPGTNVAMDISENLKDIGVFYVVYPYNEVDNLEVSHPQSRDSLTKNMLGQTNQSNISEYFNFPYVNEKKQGSGRMLVGSEMVSYDRETGKITLTDSKDGKTGIYFYLEGTPKQTVENVKIIPGFYFREYGNENGNNYEYSSENNGDFVNVKNANNTGELPSFMLTVYDKSKLYELLKNKINEITKVNEDQVEVENFMSHYEALAVGLYTYISRNVTQSEIDEAIKNINDNPLKLLAKADYTDLDKVKSDIGALNRSYYKEGSFTEIDELLKKYEANLSENYQVKVDNLTKKLTEKYNALEMLDADYSRVEDAIKTSELLTNKTSDGKNLYTNESWNKLQEAIKAVVDGKKINEQELVNQYAVNISKAIAELEYAPADYSKLNDLIDEYNLYKEYYLEESKVEFEEYLKNVTYDKNITEQNKVDKWYEDLSKLAESLELRKALGYYDSDNYDFIKQMGYMSFEGYERYFKGLQKEYYTDESVEMIDMVLEAFDDPELRGYTINEQAEFDQVLFSLQMFVDMLKKKPGNFDELCKYYSEALNLNTNYYEDLTKLNDALSNVDFNLKMDEQDKIDETTKALKDAINNLVLKDADYTLFNEAYNKATSLNPRHYVDFSAVEEAITEANANKNLKIDKQSKVDEVTEKLKKAMSKLVLKDADYSKIEALKAIINDIDSSKYTNFNVVEEALNDIVYGKKANEQDLVDEMYNKLKKAYDSLQKTKADYSELNKVVEKANKYESQKDNYENYQDLKKLLDGIDYDLTWDKQSVVDDYVDKINDAINSLRKKSADYTELQEQLSKIPSDYSNLDRNLQNEIESLLNEARNLPNDLTYDEQSRIDDLVVKFKDLINRIPKDNSLENVQGNVQGGIKDNTQGNSSNGVVSNQVVLSYLRVNGNNVDIRTLPFRYSVGYNVTSANIEVGLSSKKSVSKVYGGKVLLPGDNNITIIVTTSNGKTYTYTLIITRSNASDYLSDLKIKQYDINFVKTKQEYTIKIGKNVEKLDLSVKAEDKNAKVNIKGNNNLKNGSKVYVEVKSQDGRVRVYTINIQKSGYVDLKVIAIIIMILIIILGAIKYIQEKRKYNQKDSE